MKNIKFAAFCATAAAIASLFSPNADATVIAYTLDQSNADIGTLIDGGNFGTVTIDDDTVNSLQFTITLSPLLTSIAGANFGIDSFSFNVIGANPVQDLGTVPGQWTLPGGWTANVAPPPNQSDGFGRFDVEAAGSGGTRQSTLTFRLNGTALNLYSFAEASTNNAGQGNVYFSAHIAGFNGPNGITSAYFGGSTLTPVPLPAGLTLLVTALASLGIFRRRTAR